MNSDFIFALNISDITPLLLLNYPTLPLVASMAPRKKKDVPPRQIRTRRNHVAATTNNHCLSVAADKAPRQVTRRHCVSDNLGTPLSATTTAAITNEPIPPVEPLKVVENNKSMTNEEPSQPDPLPPAECGVKNKDGELVPQQPSLAEALPPGDDETINSAANGNQMSHPLTETTRIESLMTRLSLFHNSLLLRKHCLPAMMSN